MAICPFLLIAHKKNTSAERSVPNRRHVSRKGTGRSGNLLGKTATTRWRLRLPDPSGNFMQIRGKRGTGAAVVAACRAFPQQIQKEIRASGSCPVPGDGTGMAKKAAFARSQGGRRQPADSPAPRAMMAIREANRSRGLARRE
jgi:hypothetical protein